MMKIGTIAGWFGVGLFEGIKASERVGATGVQLSAVNELNPKTVDSAMIEKAKKFARDHNQVITAFGSYSFEGAEHDPRKIEYMKTVIDLASRLECKVVPSHVGVIPDEPNEKYRAMQHAIGTVGEYAAKQGVTFAIETGPEPIKVLKPFVDSCVGVGINYDPANLIMVLDEDVVQGVYTAKSSIVHTHAKDGVIHKYLGAEKVYDIIANAGIEELQRLGAEYMTEVRLGTGSVPWPEYLKALKDIGFDGYLTIEREMIEDRKDADADIAHAVVFLREHLDKIYK